LGLDFAGAAFLAYDVLYGPHARSQASIRRTRLAIATESQERCERSLRELSESSASSEGDDRHRLRQELSTLSRLNSEAAAELTHWERHEHRAQLNALLGLLFLMAGFACQAVGAVVSGQPK
jgi:hypothetical protein